MFFRGEWKTTIAVAELLSLDWEKKFYIFLKWPHILLLYKKQQVLLFAYRDPSGASLFCPSGASLFGLPSGASLFFFAQTGASMFWPIWRKFVSGPTSLAVLLYLSKAIA